MNVGDANIQTNLAADSAVFPLAGGKYGCVAVGTFNSGSMQLQGLAPDGTTYVAVATAISAAGFSTVEIPAGQYKWVKSGSPSAMYLAVSRIPV